MQYAASAIRHQLSVFCRSQGVDKSTASRVGEIAGVLWTADKTAPNANIAFTLWKMYRPLNVVAVPDEARSVLPKLESFESPVISEPILGKCGDVVFVKA